MVDSGSTRYYAEIRGFDSPGEYRRFVSYIQGEVQQGTVPETPPDPKFNDGMITGGRGFRDSATGEIWRLLPPDFPFRGKWERLGTVSPGDAG